MYDTKVGLLLEESAESHRHLCPRQVLGVRMGLLAGELLGIEVPQESKRLLAIIETDGCAADGISVSTGCWVGRRTLRVEDQGKISATFVDTKLERAIRIAPRSAIRELAKCYAPEAKNRWESYLIGYRRIPLDQLFSTSGVTLNRSVKEILSRPSSKAICGQCGEEIINEREVEISDGTTLCAHCAGSGYYETAWVRSANNSPITEQQESA